MRTVATLQAPDAGTVNLDGLDVLANKDEVRKIPRLPAAGVRRVSESFRRWTCSIIWR